MESYIKEYLKISSVFILTVVSIFILGIATMVYLSPKHYNQLLLSIYIIIIFIVSLLIFGTSLVSYCYVKNYCPGKLRKFVKSFILLMYPLISILCKVTKMDKSKLKLFLIGVNNILIQSENHRFAAKDIMLLAPHCLQDSSCGIKVTGNVLNCKQCGKCCISKLLTLSERFSIPFFVVSGGTLARKVISENNPMFIISIACERDLWSGIQDVHNIPVYGIVNNRPNGPCNNTLVDCELVENIIKQYKK